MARGPRRNSHTMHIVHFQDIEASYTFHTAEEDGRLIDKKVCRIPVRIYDSLEELVEAINSANATYRHQMLEPLKNRKGSYIIRRMCNCPQIYIMDFNEKNRRVFGFDEAVQKGSFTTFNEGFRNIAASSPASLSRALPDQMYFNTYIWEPYTVGDTQASLLRIVYIDNSSFKYGCSTVQRFAPIQYIPLLYHNFRSIVIDIRDQHGERIPFQYGTLTVTLHFKRKRLHESLRTVLRRAHRRGWCEKRFCGFDFSERGGVGAWLDGLLRRILPYVTSGAKALGKDTLCASIKVVDDVANSGVNFQEAIKSRAKESGHNLKRKAADEISEIMKGSGYKTTVNGKRRR